MGKCLKNKKNKKIRYLNMKMNKEHILWGALIYFFSFFFFSFLEQHIDLTYFHSQFCFSAYIRSNAECIFHFFFFFKCFLYASVLEVNFTFNFKVILFFNTIRDIFGIISEFYFNWSIVG